MRLGPTSNRPPRRIEQQRLACAKCKAAFPSLQMVKINGKQLCIWCAGRSEKMPTRSFTMTSQTTVRKRRVVYKNL
jgi:hypothetical protein